MSWPALNRLLERFQVPRPRIVEKNGQRMPCQRELSLLPTAAGLPATEGKPAGECESELT